MKKPGYLARLAGEVVHILKCTPKEVKILHTEKCFSFMPVWNNNETWFLTPKTHILTRESPEIPCNQIIPTMFRVDNEWIKFTPTPTITTKPNTLHPQNKITWTYKSAGKLATSGIYSEKDLDDLQDHLLFPMEKPAMLDSLARGMLGQIPSIDGRIVNLLTNNVITDYLKNLWETMKEDYWNFSIESAGFIGIIVILGVIHHSINTIIRFYTLHKWYGWSLRMLAAIFSACMHLLIAIGPTRTINNYIEPPPANSPNDFELREIYHGTPQPSRSPSLRNPPPRHITQNIPTGLFSLEYSG